MPSQSSSKVDPVNEDPGMVLVRLAQQINGFLPALPVKEGTAMERFDHFTANSRVTLLPTRGIEVSLVKGVVPQGSIAPQAEEAHPESGCKNLPFHAFGSARIVPSEKAVKELKS
jgi:hypothetical protein